MKFCHKLKDKNWSGNYSAETEIDKIDTFLPNLGDDDDDDDVCGVAAGDGPASAAATRSKTRRVSDVSAFVVRRCEVVPWLSTIRSGGFGRLEQGCQMVCFQTKNPKFGQILEGL
jgi:hypothetical protein